MLTNSDSTSLKTMKLFHGPYQKIEILPGSSSFQFNDDVDSLYSLQVYGLDRIRSISWSVGAGLMLFTFLYGFILLIMDLNCPFRT